jgi:hypothetical protein
MNDSMRILLEVPVVLRIGAAAVVPSVVQPESVDGHDVGAAIRSRRHQPVARRLF